MASKLSPIRPCMSCLESSIRSLRLSALTHASTQLFRPSQQQVRTATHKSEGRANGPKDGAGKRLGCKKTQGQYVIPGNIIFKQRGTKWMPGDNVGLGRDHTIYATQPGYVRFYRDPERNPDKKYIGVVLRPTDRLPAPRNCPTRRLLGMTAHKMVESVRAADVSAPSMIAGLEGTALESGLLRGADGKTGVATQTSTSTTGLKNGLPPLQSLQNIRPGYQFRVANWEIGRAGERAGIEVKPYDPHDRFAAWRKRSARRAKAAEMRSVSQRKKK